MFYRKRPARFGWKPIPNNARVTRDEVSGLRMKRKQLSGRQYLAVVLLRLDNKTSINKNKISIDK